MRLVPPMCAPAPADLDALLAHYGWAQRLARALATPGVDADDLVQEAYARALSAARGRADAASAAAPRAWLARIVRNTWIDGRRRAAHAQALDATAAPAVHEPTPDELAARAELQERLAAAVLGLPPVQRNVVLLRHFDGAPVADIARRLGLARATVHDHLARAHEALRRRFAGLEEDPRSRRGLALLLAAPDPHAASVAVPLVGAAAPATSLALLAVQLTKPLLAVAVAATLFVTVRHVSERAPRADGPGDAEANERAELTPPAPAEASSAAPLDVPASPTGTSRFAVAPSHESDAPGTATLRVQVVDELRRALADATVSFELTDAEKSVRGISVGPGEWILPDTAAKTDAAGCVTLEVPAGRPLVLHADAFVPEWSSRERAESPALARGETNELVIAVRTQPDLDVELTVVDDATGQPIAGAALHIEPGGPARSRNSVLDFGARAPDVHTDGAGRAHVRLRSWLSAWCTAEADGYAPKSAQIHTRTDAAAPTRTHVELELDKGARIEGYVRGASTPLEARLDFARAAISAALPPGAALESPPTRTYRRRIPVSAEGTFVAEDLPGEADVTLALHDVETGAEVHRRPAPVITATGVTRRVDIDLATNRCIVCTVREADGAPARGHVVQLFPGSVGRAGRTDDRWRPAATVETDADGVARFEGLASGTWLVGLAAAQPRKRGNGDTAVRSVAAYAVTVDVPEAAGDVPAALTLHRGLFITGRVVAPGGLPEALLVGAGTGGFHAMSQGVEIEEGVFRVGPLVPGTYELTAMALGSGKGPSYAPSERIQAEAGATGVELVLRAGAALALRAVDATTGEAVPAEYTSASQGSGDGYRSTYGAAPQRRLTGLAPGTYVALAQAADGRVGLAEGLAAEAGADVEVAIPVGPGGTLALLAAEGDGIVDAYVVRGGAAVCLERLEPGDRTHVVLPPGPYRVGFVRRRPGETQPAWVDSFDEAHEIEVRVAATTELAPRVR